jgi:hypothetical protein
MKFQDFILLCSILLGIFFISEIDAKYAYNLEGERIKETQVLLQHQQVYITEVPYLQ